MHIAYHISCQVRIHNPPLEGLSGPPKIHIG